MGDRPQAVDARRCAPWAVQFGGDVVRCPRAEILTPPCLLERIDPGDTISQRVEEAA